MPDPSPASSSSAPERPQRQEGKPPSWRVDPPPHGRGAPPAQPPPLLPRHPRGTFVRILLPPLAADFILPLVTRPPTPPTRRGTFVGILVALLAVNFILALVTSQPTQRTRVPYQPFFVQQVQSSNVQEISSKDQTIDGDLKKPATYTPPGGKPETVD